MDFSIFYQLRTKKIWWVDVVFYFVISLLISAIFCYLIFISKIYLQEKEIKKLDAAIETVGTDVQKDHEKTVFNYQKKINDYALLIDNHEFASNVFGFLEKDTLPNVWFSRFSLPTKQNKVDLTGEAESMDALSRQTAAFEKNEFVKKVNLLGSSVGDSGKVNFSLSLLLDSKIFNYIQPPPAENLAITENNNVSVNPAGENRNAEKLITSFDLPLTPEVIGVINQTNHTITLNVPQGTNVINLSPSISSSIAATVSPASNVSQNFTNQVVYTVTAEDGSAQNYTVTVIAGAPVNAGSTKSKTNTVVVILIIAVAIVAILGTFFFFKKRSAKKSGLINNINAQNGN
ncbi:MAG: hypothetical protein A3G45_01955 [Candidatus Staskawiczbacteria bacterium RIFCSPLOWO2_12_FULL_37_15]|uniref:DUF5018 domain-containing protein n=1 Tax=Candidatus Staskawiczbacteria bacterium RIFCSPLOWO2_12_FULL_37_15 TaxID=1802218 RepID=A0A1G2IRF0_9BACT|nr:MAG: hypothetical protein US35_C0018G0006 [Parcubacteria group bacterium GW2011_GWA2_37_10]OGZ76738.1 MAG: hypothetical protein A3G45_01955 [Candidatus Staskawiczbacteria bacterium RIFCSPLOWO2_12_FULL_37_15]